MEQTFNYMTKLDVRFEHLEKIDIPKIVSECKDISCLRNTSQK
jgi:hypothetical protein